MVFLWVESRFAGAFVFLFLDVTTAWCISRSVQVMQGFYIYWRAKQGANVPMARSGIPLIYGELLQDTTRFPSIFAVLNGILLVLLFIRALGINGETRPHYSLINLTHVTSFSGDEDFCDSWKNPLNRELETTTYRL